MARVLLIDDSPFQNAWMSSMLERAGHQIVIACSGSVARTAAKTGVDVCLVELILLRENGFELAVIEELSTIPVVLMLARRQEADLEWSQALGIQHYLYRPCRQAVLESLLREILPDVTDNRRPREGA